MIKVLIPRFVIFQAFNSREEFKDWRDANGIEVWNYCYDEPGEWYDHFFTADENELPLKLFFGGHTFHVFHNY